MSEPHFDFGSPERDERPVHITPTRPMLLQRYGEELPRHAEAGERVTVAGWVAASLHPNDYRPA